MSAGIYAIVNVANGRRYIGSSARVCARLRQHGRDLSLGCHFNKHLQAAWNKYGEDQFRFVIVETVPNTDLLLDREQVRLTEHYPHVYNIGRHAARPFLGVKRSPMTEVHRQRLIAAHVGRLAPHTPAQREKIIAANKRRTGTHHTDAAKAKISAVQMGRKRPMKPETREKIRAIHTGMKASAEARKAMSEAAKRRVRVPFTTEQRANMSAAKRLWWQQRKEQAA